MNGVPEIDMKKILKTYHFKNVNFITMIGIPIAAGIRIFNEPTELTSSYFFLKLFITFAVFTIINLMIIPFVVHLVLKIFIKNLRNKSIWGPVED